MIVSWLDSRFQISCTSFRFLPGHLTESDSAKSSFKSLLINGRNSRRCFVFGKFVWNFTVSG